MSADSSDRQQFLFSESQMRSFGTPPASQPVTGEMDSASLQAWKAKLADYQLQIRRDRVLTQGSLFPVNPALVEPEAIDPFVLEQHHFFFFQGHPDRNPNETCLYFVFDSVVPLLLYIGETCAVTQRWRGYHDCKRYVLNYQSLHFKHHIRTAINTGFWWQTPDHTHPRQKLEAYLINKWKPPFNKENWSFWGTPFIYR
jgi:hypothetical protein